MDMDRYIGRLLDNRYEILEVIGSGGMSVVYKARCHRLNRLVAIKILKDENLQDEDFRRRFHAESQAVAMLSHPNIVSVYDVSSSEDADYIVMELIDGITLKQYMEKKGVLNWKETLHFATQIAKALEHAHSRGLVHRDIKPHNVMVLKNGSVKVADFGIARIMSQSNTLTKEALGSVHYISPEQAKGGRVDNRSDIYSLGVVMYEMITGRPPYDGDSPVAVAIQHINGGASRPATLNPNVPRGLEQIIMKSMARDLHKRYPSATAMLYDLDEFRKDPAIIFGIEAVVAADPSAATRVVTGVAEQEAATEAARSIADEKVQAAPPVRRRERTLQAKSKEENRSSVATIAIVACSVVAMIAIVVFLMLMLGGNGQENPTSVRIPNLLGMQIDNVPDYPGVEVVEMSPEYNEQYAAGQIIRQEPSADQLKPYGTKVYVTVSLGKEPDPILTPSVAGMNFEAAKAALEATGLELYIKQETANSSSVAAGLVISSDPASGEKLKDGQTVVLTVSLGPKIITAEMPDLLKNGGWDLETAQGMMERRGFQNVTWEPINSLLPEGRVLSQSVAAGEEVDVNTAIVIEYSNGVAPGEEPENPDNTENPDENPDDTTDPGDTDDTENPDIPVEPVDLTIQYTITDLPVRSESYYLSVLMDGNAVVVNLEVPAGESSVIVELTGSGVKECVIYVDGEEYKTVSVDFEAENAL